MGMDTILLIILAVGTIVLNKDIILADWRSGMGKDSSEGML